MPFTPDSIKQVIVHHKPQIQECYEETWRTKRRRCEGKLKTSFVITAEGLVKNAEGGEEGHHAEGQGLHDCVVAVLTAMSFPKPPDGKDHPIEYPFNLKAIE